MNVVWPASSGCGRAAGLSIIVVAGNVAAWTWAGAEFGSDPALLGMAVIAYVFGLRHAVDADHIAAIDNATRKLVEAGGPAAATGLYFSLGHATVVVLGSLAIALMTAGLQASLAGLKPLASAFAAGVSALSLFVLALANCAIVAAALRLLAAIRRGERPSGDSLDPVLAPRGVLARLLRGSSRLIAKSWHMYPLGLLFGLGFDTASEIAVLGISAAQASHGLPLHAVMAFPALFAAGMALVDTLDAALMAGAYRWACAEPLRKLWYNLAITLVSVIVAATVGGIEILGLFADAGATGAFWQAIARANEHLAAIGSAIVALFALTWLVSVLIWRARSTS